MYTLLDKKNKTGYDGIELSTISEKSGISVHTLRSWNKKGIWFENMRYILFEGDLMKSRRGGINSGNEKYFKK